MQIERFITHNNRFIVTRKLFCRLVARYKPHITLAVDRHDNLLKTTLTQQRRIDLIMTMHGCYALLVPGKVQFNLNFSSRGLQHRRKALKTAHLHYAFQRNSAVNQSSRFDVRGYGSRHKRAILGAQTPPVKTI
ncbi:hypothetical protein YSKK_24970 [Halopseudomonas aestusnigri]|nr:hypothetical protein MFKK_32330 [Halopseudomonas aestusnigri]GMQ54635.1 hypothetical protein YSKK_24970 [Halopseudomonas aestusnigri]